MKIYLFSLRSYKSLQLYRFSDSFDYSILNQYCLCNWLLLLHGQHFSIFIKNLHYTISFQPSIFYHNHIFRKNLLCKCKFLLPKRCHSFSVSILHFLSHFLIILNKKISSRLIVGTSVAGLLVIGLQLPIIGWITEYLISPLFSSNILYKVLYYTTSDIEPWPINIKVFFYLAILFVIVYNRNKLAERFPYFNIILNLLFLFVLLRNVLWESVELDMRLGFYMSLGMTMGFPLLFEIVSRKLIRQLTFVVFVFVNWYQCQNYFFSIPTFSPYQNYIVHKIFKLPSNGEERLYELMNRENND